VIWGFGDLGIWGFAIPRVISARGSVRLGKDRAQFTSLCDERPQFLHIDDFRVPQHTQPVNGFVGLFDDLPSLATNSARERLLRHAR
jgi:hypothetical protein